MPPIIGNIETQHDHISYYLFLVILLVEGVRFLILSRLRGAKSSFIVSIKLNTRKKSRVLNLSAQGVFGFR